MLKKLATAASLVVIAPITFWSTNKTTVQEKAIERHTTEKTEKTHTELYIINGDYESSRWFDGPSKSELLTALTEYPQHLFITPSVWHSFCDHRKKQLDQLKKDGIYKPFEQLEIAESKIITRGLKNRRLSQEHNSYLYLATVLAFDENEWDFYDTNIGLYYLKPRDEATSNWLNISSFKKIASPCNMQAPKQKTEWAPQLHTLFDEKKWHNAHSQKSKKIICFSGHGTSQRGSHKRERACGIPAEQFAKLLIFFDETLKVDTIGIQTCYWPAERIMKLLGSIYNKKTLQCHLITPINQEHKLNYQAEIPIVWSYDPQSQEVVLETYQKGKSFIAGLADIAHQFAGTLTHGLTNVFKDIKVVQTNHRYNLKTSLISAHSTEAVHV